MRVTADGVDDRTPQQTDPKYSSVAAHPCRYPTNDSFMKIKSAGLSLAAAAATAFAPFGMLAALTFSPVAHAGCPGLTDGIGNNTAAAHNSCCADAQMAGVHMDNCGGGPAPLPPAMPPQTLGPCPGGTSPGVGPCGSCGVNACS